MDDSEVFSAVIAAPASPRSRKLTILHVINDLGLGGAEALLYRMSTESALHRHVIVSVLEPAWYSSRLLEKGVEVHHLNVRSVAKLGRGITTLNRIIRETRPDVVQCWMYRSNVLGGLVGRAMKRPVVWGIHHSNIDTLRPRSRALAYLSGLLARCVPDFVINCSTRSAEIHDKIGFSHAPGAVIHNGYDPSAFFPDEGARPATRAALGLSGEDFAIASIGRWHPQKDIPNFLAALRLIEERRIPFKAYLLGAGLTTDNEELRGALEQSRCVNLVRLLGPRSDVQDIARAIDLHVLASAYGEAFPNVVAETMLSGTPNVVTDVGDAALMVGETGWVAAPRNPGQLADAIICAFKEWKVNRRQWKRRQTAVRQHIAENFSFERMVLAYENVWSTLSAG